MSEQIDIAVDLAVVPPPLPEILTLRQLVEMAPAAPPEIIEGVLHQGCKMVLGGTSKSNKSWCLLDLSLSVASGSDWWGRRCMKSSVLYINFELHSGRTPRGEKSPELKVRSPKVPEGSWLRISASTVQHRSRTVNR